MLYIKKIKKLNRLFWAHIITPVLLLLTFPIRACRKKRFEKNFPPKTILISFFGRGLGDSIYLAGHLKKIRSRFPGSKIQLAILEQLEPYFRGNPFLDEILACPDFYNGFSASLRFYQSALKLRKHKPDLLVNLSPTLAMLPVFWDFLMAKRYSIGIGDSLKRLFYDQPVPIDWRKHYYLSIQNGLQPLGIHETEPSFWIPPDEDLQNLKELDQIGFSKSILIAPGGRRSIEAPKEYCWHYESFSKVVHDLLTLGHRVILTGAPYDRELAKKIQPHPLLINLVGKTSLLQIFTIAKKFARLVACNNSGLLHIANVLNIPSVSYADPKENMLRWGTYPDHGKHIFLQDTLERKVTPEEFVRAIVEKISTLEKAATAAKSQQNLFYKK